MNLVDLIYIPVAIAYSPRLFAKRREGWRERFGHTPPLPPPPPGRPRILLHAVSVGEVSALRTLVPLLAGHADVVVSATTDTGLARARDLFGAACHVVRFPLDFSRAVRRFLDAVRPAAAAMVELELWPNFLSECRRRAIRTCVINGRLSQRSFRGYRRIRRLVRDMFRGLEFAAVQDDAYAARFQHMGVHPHRCFITGSMKWDAATLGGADDPRAIALARDLGIDPARPLIVAGSTGPGEEDLLHRACPTGVQLLCAPRKPERFNEAAAALPGCTRRSAGRSAPADRFLLDSIGELRFAYMLADLVVMGRSFFNLHGSDPVEPAALGKPVVIGPEYGDFRTMVDALRAASGIHIATRDSLAEDLSRLMNESSARDSLARSGARCIAEHQGASRRHAELLLSLVGIHAAATRHEAAVSA